MREREREKMVAHTDISVANLAHQSKSLPTTARGCCSASGRIVLASMTEIKIIFEYMYEKKTFNKLELSRYRGAKGYLMKRRVKM